MSTAPAKLVSLSPYRKGLVLAYVVCAVWYLVWRWSTVNPAVPSYGWLVYALEVGGFLAMGLHLYLTWAITARSATPPPDGLSVEVLVLADSNPEVVRRTVRAALEMQQSHATCLVDPAALPTFADMAREMGVRYAGTQGTSARCMNEALQQSQADVIVIFDGDHAPRPDFLVKTLGYFTDDSVAFVQTPEDAYNLDSYEHRLRRKDGAVWSEESLSQKVLQPGRDRFNGAVLAQSCCLVRRRALDAVGGFVDAELLHTSIRLHRQGYRSVYHNESLAFGLAPADLGSFLQKRVVDARAGLSLWWRNGFLLAPGLSFNQRLCYLSTVLPALDGWARGAFYFLPGIILWTGILPIQADGADFLLHFMPYFLLGVWAFEESGRGYARWLLSELYKVARFYALSKSVFQRPSSDPASASSLTVPHCLLSALNLSGVGIALLPLIDLHPPLPAVATAFCVVWAFAVFTLSAWVMASVERPHRRAEYRFPIPLPVRLDDGLVGTVDDISTSGLKIHARLPAAVTVGSVLRGDLLVPGGTVGFTAVVVSLYHGDSEQGDYLKSVGCKVDWATPEDRERLERLLYGSDLQLKVMALTERHQTLAERIAHGLQGRDAATHGWRLWAPVYYDAADGGHRVGLISNGGQSTGDRHLLLFTQAPQQPSIQVTMVTRLGDTVINCPLQAESRIETALSPIFLYNLNPAGSTLEPHEPTTASRL